MLGEQRSKKVKNHCSRGIGENLTVRGSNGEKGTLRLVRSAVATHPYLNLTP